MSESQDRAQAESDTNRLRRRIQSALRALNLDAYNEESAAIVRHLAQWEPLQKASIVAAFFPSRTEAQLQPLLHGIVKSKVLLLPRVIPGNAMEFVQVHDPARDLHHGTFGLMEPRLVMKPWQGEDPQVFLVPGVVFGRYGERIGHGGGYYDRHLSKYSKALKVGVALSCQVVTDDVPQLPHDVRMNYIVSPIGITPTSF